MTKTSNVAAAYNLHQLMRSSSPLTCTARSNRTAETTVKTNTVAANSISENESGSPRYEDRATSPFPHQRLCVFHSDPRHKKLVEYEQTHTVVVSRGTEAHNALEKARRNVAFFLGTH